MGVVEKFRAQLYLQPHHTKNGTSFRRLCGCLLSTKWILFQVYSMYRPRVTIPNVLATRSRVDGLTLKNFFRVARLIN